MSGCVRTGLVSAEGKSGFIPFLNSGAEGVLKAVLACQALKPELRQTAFMTVL